MAYDPRATLAENLRRIIDFEKSNPSAWASAHRIDKKPVQRALSGKHATTIDTIEALAAAAGLHAWQLLAPGLDPANPPVYAMTRSERDLYSKIRSDFANLPPVNNH